MLYQEVMSPQPFCIETLLMKGYTDVLLCSLSCLLRGLTWTVQYLVRLCQGHSFHKTTVSILHMYIILYHIVGNDEYCAYIHPCGDSLLYKNHGKKYLIVHFTFKSQNLIWSGSSTDVGCFFLPFSFPITVVLNFDIFLCVNIKLQEEPPLFPLGRAVFKF